MTDRLKAFEYPVEENGKMEKTRVTELEKHYEQLNYILVDIMPQSDYGRSWKINTYQTPEGILVYVSVFDDGSYSIRV